MNSEWQDLAVDYVLGHLSGEEKHRFVLKLDRDPALRDLVAGLEQTLGQVAEAGQAPPLPPDLWAGIEQKLAAEPLLFQSADKNSKKMVVAAPPGLWQRVLRHPAWAIAACGLLVWNVYDRAAGGLIGPEAGQSFSGNGMTDASGRAGGAGDSRVAGAAGGDARLLLTRLEQLQAEKEALQAVVASKERNLDEALGQLDGLDAHNAKIAADYMRLADRFFPFYESKPGLGRFTVIELRDAESASDPNMRFGIPEKAFEMLTKGSPLTREQLQLAQTESLVPGKNNAVQGPSPGPGIVTAAGFTSDNALTLSSSANTGRVNLSGGNSASLVDQTGGDNSSGALPSAWIVHNDAEEIGVINMVEFPDLAPGTTAILEMRGSLSEEFESFGVIPFDKNSDGRILYSTQGKNMTPLEVRIVDQNGNIIVQGP